MKRMAVAMVLLYASLFFFISCASYRVSTMEDFEVNEGLTRSQLVNCPINEQVALFIKLSPEMKCRLYRYKIEQELAGQNLSAGEKRWLKRLLHFVTPEFYENGSTKRFESFEKKFSKKMKDEYGWTDKDFFLYTETIMTSEEYNLFVQSH